MSTTSHVARGQLARAKKDISAAVVSATPIARRQMTAIRPIATSTCANPASHTRGGGLLVVYHARCSMKNAAHSAHPPRLSTAAAPRNTLESAAIRTSGGATEHPGTPLDMDFGASRVPR